MKFRTRYLIHPKFQLLFSAMLILIALICALWVGAIIYILIYTNNLIYVKYNIHTSPQFLSLLVKQGRIVVVAWIASFAIIAVILFIAGIFLSHRMAGPLFALTREMKKLKEGDLTAHLRLRKRDEFKELKAPFNQWVESMRKMTFEDINTMSNFRDDLKHFIEELKQQHAKIEDISKLQSLLTLLEEMIREKNHQLYEAKKI